MTTLDYAALNQPATQADIAAFRAVKSKPQSKGVTVIAFIVGGITLLGIITSMIASIVTHGAISESTFIPTIAIALIIFFVVVTSRAQLKKRAQLYKFATANKLNFIYDVLDPGYAGMIFDEGDSRRIQEAFVFEDGTEIGNYQYSTGSGKNRQTHSWSYVRIKLTRRLPNMVLDARKNNVFGKLSNLPDSFSRGQILALEGDFNNYFTLYAPKEYERDALYVFTPDVMAAVIDTGQTYDMEVIDDSLMLYSPGATALTSETHLKTLLGIIEKIGTELRDQSHRYADERVGDRALNIVAEPGARLKTRIPAVGVATIIFIVIYTTFNFIIPLFTR